MTQLNLLEASFERPMDNKTMPETDIPSAPMRELQSVGYAYPTPDDSKRSSVSACDCDLEKAVLVSSIQDTAAREDRDKNVIDWDGPDDRARNS